MKDNYIEIRFLGLPLFNCEFNTPECFKKNQTLKDAAKETGAAFERMEKAYLKYWSQCLHGSVNED